MDGINVFGQQISLWPSKRSFDLISRSNWLCETGTRMNLGTHYGRCCDDCAFLEFSKISGEMNLMTPNPAYWYFPD